MKTAIEILSDAREILSSGDRLVRFTVACDASGRNVAPLDADARRWCSTGAIVKAAGTASGVEVAVAIAALARAMGGNVPRFHDNSLRYQILDKFAEAIALLRARQPQECLDEYLVLYGRLGRAALRQEELA